MVKWKNRSQEDKERILIEQQATKDGAKSRGKPKELVELDQIWKDGNIPIWCRKCVVFVDSEHYTLIDHSERIYPIAIGHCRKCGEEGRHPLIPTGPFTMLNHSLIILKLLREGRLTDKRKVKKERV